MSGHAIEARLYAEDPENGFLPQSGALIDWRPASGEGVRIDHGLAAGLHGEPVLRSDAGQADCAGATREEARRRLIMALEDTVALGLKTNRSLLIAMLRHPAFAAGEVTTAFIDQYFPTGRRHGAVLRRRMRACSRLPRFCCSRRARDRAGAMRVLLALVVHRCCRSGRCAEASGDAHHVVERRHGRGRTSI